ncbi:hypothetical protein BAZSYMB_SCAFFOLD00057_1 [Bathymodiolus azoricus thioautotrophic gill symbiont]|uniref:Uncharacterized protein n=1 Tax=Bathymodiolus azoricus thioautotrophic gill symbiont TaxID=235205 RepID=A0A1H6K019_9GAMM|nr:hypothetical protein BAZSYMB_SCAFFOLD00057_1 [Bathymodiolus azoricus thioautotrophic gill symbiont]
MAIIHFPCTPFGHSLLPTLIELSFNCPHVFGFSLAFPVVPEVNKIATVCCAFISKFSIF